MDSTTSKPISPPLAWLRKFCSAAFGGAADGMLIGLGGTGALSVMTKTPVDIHAIGYFILINIALDTSRFVKANSDPWEFNPVSEQKP